MPNFPTGTVTFLFTDIEGSTTLAQKYPEKWETLRNRHHDILHTAMDAHRGYVFEIIGDAFCVAFSTAGEALKAAGQAQNDLYVENWGESPIKVRMGIHTGKAEFQVTGQYNGYLTLSRVQRIMSAGYGGQTLISQATQELVRDELPVNVSLGDLGEHHLKDLIRSEHIYQLNINGQLVNYPPLKTLDLYHHNLPLQMTSFIGREKEMAEIKQALVDHYLVTLTGSGGSGKTRLALQVAADLIEDFKDGVWFVDLSHLSDPTVVPQAIAFALNVREEGASPLIDLLVNYVQRRELLILLDNCEHLVEACARITNLMLRSAPHLKVIASSREALGVVGEKIFPVPSLAFSNSHHPTLATLSQYEATRLFIDRALLVHPHFTVTNENAPAVAQICYRLDGIPLAIELAAARIKAMSPEQINARLDESFRLLIGGSRTAIPRQQTLRAMINWSWELLSENERRLMRRLSVFSGGWTLEAAEEICASEGIDEYDVLDLLTQLVSKSLVVWHEQQDQPRYHLLETIRQFAHGKLNETTDEGEETRIRQQHADFFSQFIEHAKSQIYSPNQATWLKRLDAELDNLRAALEWAVSSQSLHALKITRELGEYFFWRNIYAEGIQWCERALNANPKAPVELRAYSLVWASMFSNQIGHSNQASQFGMAGLELARQGQDKSLLAFALIILGGVNIETGDSKLATAYLEEALPLARETQSPFLLPFVLSYLGLMCIFAKEYAHGEAYFQESREAAKRLYGTIWQPLTLLFSGSLAFLRNDIEKARGDFMLGLQISHELQAHLFVAHIDEMIGRIEITDSNLTDARTRLTQSLTMLQDMSLKPCLAHGLEGLARLALARGESQRAVRILGAIDAHMKTLGMNMIPVEQAMYDQTLAAVKQQLNARAFQQEWTEGEKLNVEQAIELAMK